MKVHREGAILQVAIANVSRIKCIIKIECNSALQKHWTSFYVRYSEFQRRTLE